MKKTCETCEFLVLGTSFMRPHLSDGPCKYCRRWPPVNGEFAAVNCWQRELGCGEWRKREDDDGQD